jgi:TonB family protein
MTAQLLLETSLKTSGIVALALLGTFLLRRRSAAMRHWILAAALACAAGAPALERFVPAWQLPSTPWWTKDSIVVQGFLTAEALAKAVSPADTVRTPEGLRHVPSREAARDSRSSEFSFVQNVWLAGVAVSFLALLIGLARLAWIVSRARELHDGAWIRIADEVSREYGLRRRVRLLQSAHPTLLATWGWARPRVVLPAGAAEWSDDRIRIVLLHELAHVVRNDWATQLFAAIVRSVYWFSPFVWIAGRRLRQESERAADDAVLNRGIDGATYASELLTLARTFGPYGNVWAPAPGIARASSLERRVTAMLSPAMNRRPPSRVSRFGTAAALFAATVAIASAQAVFSSLSGAVYDPLNGLLPNAKLTLTNEQSGAKYEIRSDSTGRFQFVGLPPGRYALETELMGFKTLRGTLEISGQSVQRDVRLEVGSLQETVSVRLSDPASPAPPMFRGRQPLVRTSIDAGRCTAAAPAGGIGGNLRPPMKLVNVAPSYPAGLSASKQGGEVVLDARIEADGTIREVRAVSSSHPDFEAAAIEAVRGWEFSETLLNCVPVEVDMKVTVRFIAE